MVDVLITEDPFKSAAFNDIDEMTVDQLRTETGWPLEYTATVGLWPYLKRINKEIQGIEVGTGRGESAYLLLEKCPNIKKLYTIDPFLAYEDWNAPVPQAKQDKFFEIAKKNLETFGDRAEIINQPGEMASFLEKLPNDSFDFVFIDGVHTQEAVLADLDNFYRKLVSNGIMAVHDTNLIPVQEAIHIFRENNRIRMPVQTISNGCVFWRKQ